MEELIGTLASGNRFRVTPYVVEVLAYPGGATLSVIDVNSVAAVWRDGSLLKLRQRDGRMVELGMQSLDDAGRAEHMLRGAIGSSAFPPRQTSADQHAALDFSGLPRGMAVAALCGVGVLAGSFGPWATVASAFGSISVAGTEGDGQITALAGLVATAIAVIKLNKPKQHVSLAVLMALAFVVALVVGAYDWVNMQSRIGDADSDFVRTSVGWGLPLLTVSAAVGILVCWQEFTANRDR